MHRVYCTRVEIIVLIWLGIVISFGVEKSCKWSQRNPWLCYKIAVMDTVGSMQQKNMTIKWFKQIGSYFSCLIKCLDIGNC